MRRPLALLAVLAVVACGGPSDGTVAAPSPSALEGCPERYLATDQPWVPAPPSTETPGRLVPDADPVEALVCRYGDVFDADSAALDGQCCSTGV